MYLRLLLVIVKVDFLKFGALFLKNCILFLSERSVYQKIYKNYKCSLSIIHIAESHFND